MKINAFYSHNLSERMALVKRDGDFICRIKYFGFFIHLYTLDGNLVEVYYNIHSNTIDEVELIDPKDERLNLYAVQVNLSDLYTKKP